MDIPTCTLTFRYPYASRSLSYEEGVMLVVLQLRVLKGGPVHIIFQGRLGHSRTLCADCDFGLV